MPNVGHATTISFGTTGWTPEVVSLGEIGEALAIIDTTHLATSGSRTYMAGTIKTPKQLNMVVQYDQTDLPALTGTSETITITLPSTKTVSFSGILFDRTLAGVQSEEMLTMNVVIQPTGSITWSA